MSDPWIESRRAIFLQMAEKSESVVEAGLLWAMLCHGWPGKLTFGPGCEWEIEPQAEVETPGRVHRVDLAVRNGDLRIAIEVDGHAYHHATQEQKERDDIRELAVRLAGWQVIRVPAWRVLQSPILAAKELVNDIAERVRYPVQPPKTLDEDLTDDEFEVALEPKTYAVIRAETEGRHELAADIRNSIERRRARRFGKIMRELFDKRCAGSP